MQLTFEQVTLLGVGASVTVSVVKLLYAQLGSSFLGRKTLTLLLFAVSLVLAYFWASPSLPVFPPILEDPVLMTSAVLAFLGQGLSVVGAICGFAFLIYNLLLEKVLEGLGWTPLNIIENKAK